MSKIDNHSERFARLHHIAPKCGQAITRRTSRRENAAVPGSVAPGMSKSNRPDTELIKDAKQIHISAERLDSFHRNQQRNLTSLTRAKNLLIAFANGEARALFRLRVKSGYLIERYAQTHFRQIAILDVNRHAENADIARFQFGQIIRGENVCAVAFLVQVHRHVEMTIDNSVRVKPIDSFFDGFFRSRHCSTQNRELRGCHGYKT